MRSSTTDIENPDPETGEHLSDAELLRLLDGEPALSAVRDAAGHSMSCAVCGARSALLVARRRRLARLMAATDAPVPAVPAAHELLARIRRRRPFYARPAVRAATLLLVAGTLAAQPAVRRWASDRWGRVTGVGRVPSSVPIQVAPAPTAAGDTSGPVLAFEPGAGPFTIRFDVRPTAGTLTVVGDSGIRATAELLDGESLELLVMPHGLRVRNAGGAIASYLVHVPRAVGRVHVRYGPAPTPDDVVVDVGGEEPRRVIRFERRRAAPGGGDSPSHPSAK